jgi:hypothetical protein
MKSRLIFICVILYFKVFSQEDKVLIPTPEAASLIKWSKNDVNLSSGSLNTFLPLYTLKDGDLEVPIGLHYNGSSGIKVEEAATIVGLGWDLLAGGKIVRVVRDKPDESYTINAVRNEKGGIDALELGYDAIPIPGLENIATVRGSVEWKNDKYVYRGGWYKTGNPVGTYDFDKNDPMLFDLQPDIYIVNIGSEIIKFTFDSQKNPVIINNKDFKIEVIWQEYNPGYFLTKQSWSLNGTIDFAKALKKQSSDTKGMSSDFIPTALSITVGLNQLSRANRPYQNEIGFKEFRITDSNGKIYIFGGSAEYMEFNYNDQAYLNDTDRLAIAVNNLSQKIPVSWALKRIESPFGLNSEKNAIDFTYKRTGIYEPFHTTDNLVNPQNSCDVPKSKMEKFNNNTYGNIIPNTNII